MANLGIDFSNATRTLVGTPRCGVRGQRSALSLPSMKSAYELAMERLQKGAPTVSLTDDQKKQLAEIDSSFKAKIAEREVFLKGEIAKAEAAGKLEELDALTKQLTSEVRRLQEDCEDKKEKLRATFERS
ncbi:MAG: competence protein ComEC [Verrucomicrobiota bacterium]|jgi:hypothetical protein